MSLCNITSLSCIDLLQIVGGCYNWDATLISNGILGNFVKSFFLNLKSHMQFDCVLYLDFL